MSYLRLQTAILDTSFQVCGCEVLSELLVHDRRGQRDPRKFACAHVNDHGSS